MRRYGEKRSIPTGQLNKEMKLNRECIKRLLFLIPSAVLAIIAWLAELKW